MTDVPVFEREAIGSTHPLESGCLIGGGEGRRTPPVSGTVQSHHPAFQERPSPVHPDTVTSVGVQ